MTYVAHLTPPVHSFGASDKTLKKKGKAKCVSSFNILRIILLNLLPRDVLTKPITHSTSLNSLSLISHLQVSRETWHWFLHTLKMHYVFFCGTRLSGSKGVWLLSAETSESPREWEAESCLQGFLIRFPPDTLIFCFNLQPVSLQCL